MCMKFCLTVLLLIGLTVAYDEEVTESISNDQDISCSDVLPECPDYAASGFCNNAEIMVNCKLSCGGCNKQNGVPPNSNVFIPTENITLDEATGNVIVPTDNITIDEATDLCGLDGGCKNGGFCENSICVCPPFYKGEDCSQIFTDQQGDGNEPTVPHILDEGTSTNAANSSTVKSSVGNASGDGLNLNNRTLLYGEHNITSSTALDGPSSIQIQGLHNSTIELNNKEQQDINQEQQLRSNTTQTATDIVVTDEGEILIPNNIFENGDSGVGGVYLPVAMVIIASIVTLQI